MTNPSDPAFVQRHGLIEYGVDRNTGLTKREYFATAMMQGILSNPELSMELDRKSIKANKTVEEGYSQIACRMADALITELSKEVK